MWFYFLQGMEHFLCQDSMSGIHFQMVCGDICPPLCCNTVLTSTINLFVFKLVLFQRKKYCHSQSVVLTLHAETNFSLFTGFILIKNINHVTRCKDMVQLCIWPWPNCKQVKQTSICLFCFCQNFTFTFDVIVVNTKPFVLTLHFHLP